jgi:SSS family solute:Na+ symporter
MTAIYIIAGYLVLLLLLGVYSNRSFKGTSQDYFLASRGIGPFLLLMSLFGTTMTAFALVGSTGASFKGGIGIYGKLASSSGIIHSLCFFVVGIKLWSLGVKHGYMTQIQFFRDRFNSDKLGLLLFPIIVGLVIPYLLLGILGAGATLKAVSDGQVPFAAGAGVICVVVLIYVFFGGVRGTAWANCFQTLVFIVLGIVAFFVISKKLGGFSAATQAVLEQNPDKLTRTEIPQAVFFTYMLIPLSVGMFPHIFQHWLTAKSANSFKLAVVAHPLLIMVVWVPCVLIGTWATSAVYNGNPVIPEDLTRVNDVLGIMVNTLSNPILGGFLTAGIMAAIMSSLDSQFLCLGSIFTNDIYMHYFGKKEISEKQKVLTGRLFVIAVVLLTYVIAVFINKSGLTGIFTLGVWCFSGFSALFPLVVAALYWKRATTAGAVASILAGAISWIWLFANSGFGSNPTYYFLGMMPVATMIIASTLALVVVSLVTRPPDESTLKKFF